jgi:hypothetical protein
MDATTLNKNVVKWLFSLSQYVKIISTLNKRGEPFIKSTIKGILWQIAYVLNWNFEYGNSTETRR